ILCRAKGEEVVLGRRTQLWVLLQSTSGPPRVTTWSNSGKPRQCGRVAKKFTKKFTYAGEVAVGLEQRATCSFFGLRSKVGAGVGGAGVGRADAARAISASRPETESLERMAATTSVRPDHASIGDMCDLGCVCPALLHFDKSGTTATTNAR